MMAISVRNLVTFRRAIYSAKPPHAGAYFLLSDTAGRWPALGGYPFDPFELDPEIPTGTYRMYFTSTQSSGIPLPTEDGRNSPDVSWINPKEPASDEAGEAALEAAAQADAADPEPASGASGLAELKGASRTDDPALRRHRREVEQERFARDIADSRLLLGQKMRHAGESAELMVVLRSYRSELEKTARMPIALATEYMEATKRSHADYSAALGEMVKSNGELAKKLSEAQKAQPAAPAPSLLAQIVSPEGLSLAKLLAELITGREGDSDTVTATEEDAGLQRLRKKRDEAKAKLKRLQALSKEKNPSKQATGKKKSGSGKKPQKPQKESPKAAKGSKPRKRPVKGALTSGDAK